MRDHCEKMNLQRMTDLNTMSSAADASNVLTLQLAVILISLLPQTCAERATNEHTANKFGTCVDVIM